MIPSAHQIGLVTCTTCAGVWPGAAERCGRCGRRLHPVDTSRLQWVWAFWLTGLIAFIPANLYPMLITKTLTSNDASTIVGGAVEIAKHGDYAIAGIVLFASLVIPLSKFAAIAFLAITVQRGRPANRHHLHRLHEVVEFIGRWSMIDVFVVAILTALVQLSAFASIQTGPAALTFALSVIFTMFSAQAFDPRLIWTLPVSDGERAQHG